MFKNLRQRIFCRPKGCVKGEGANLKPSMMPKRSLASSSLMVGCLSMLLGLGVPATSEAQFYKWKDAQGNWHMSDEPPPESGSERAVSGVEKFGEVRPNISSVKPDGSDSGSVPSNDSSNADDGWSPTGENLAERLIEKYPDEAPIARTTLAVVTVETALGSGSGFFVTNVGHLVTNKHVVRPAKSSAMDETKAELEKRRSALRKMDRALRKEKKALREFKQELEDHADFVESKADGSSGRKIAEREHDTYLRRYKKREREFQADQRRYRVLNKELSDLKSDLNFKISMSNVARRFKIYLKDDTQIWAELVSLSDEHDLALLKVQDNETPYLTSAVKGYMSQGMSVFAIGSPMGLRDAVTKGIITGKQEGLIMTDTQILPGNSGGPLVTEWGDVVGVNTFKLAEEANRQGFGLAIPIEVVFEAFSDELPGLGPAAN